MTTEGFTASHAKGAEFERGLRSFYEYRDLGIKTATRGRVDAHVIRAAAGQEFSSQPHLHRTDFQLVYILKGWIEFEYDARASFVWRPAHACTSLRAFAIVSSGTALTSKCSRLYFRQASVPKRFPLSIHKSCAQSVA